MIENSSEVEFQFQLNLAKEEIIKQFKKIAMTAIKFIIEYNDKDSLMLDVMHQICKEIKLKATEMIQAFEEQNIELFNQLQLDLRAHS